MFGMLSVLAGLQRELIVANTNDELAAARARGRVGGRPPKLTADQAALAQRLHGEREKTVQQVADMFGVPRSTVYGRLDKTKTVPPPAQEDRGREALKATGGLFAPRCLSQDSRAVWAGRVVFPRGKHPVAACGLLCDLRPGSRRSAV
ncbi:helix-turn-helix domain-containing protein [Streptomyces sp. MRC013]|uniref:helix-turn-helix domain-containing protein n=1 Tax=Streptomyces sp. MRC013 TaxID=2898276 RepID=UPI002026FC5A|nr:helix-turn-helix domain-containing protein [Streptomyces sp. MRC013]URM90561.1 helix-turn-helix domain-containing protein [Streptomyces sp. MRC013]